MARPDLVEASAALRQTLEDIDLQHELAALLHEIDRELKFIEQQQRVYEQLKLKRNEI